MRSRYFHHTYDERMIRRRRFPAYPVFLMRRGQNNTDDTFALPRVVIQAVALSTLVVVVLIAIFVTTSVSTYFQVTGSLKTRLAELQNRQSFETSRMYARDGTLLYEFFDAGRRTTIDLDEVSPLLIMATIAVEDKTFLENSGVDYEGIARAFYQNMSSGNEMSGASTITQQIVKNVILTDEERSYERRYERKFKEVILAQELSKFYTKEQILELYLNEIYYGNMAYGIEAASQVYFNTYASDLTLAQATLLAGLPQLPSLYDPLNYQQRDEYGGFLPGLHLERGWRDLDYEFSEDVTPPKWRQISVLRQMVDEGYITEVQARVTAAEKIRFVPQDVPLHAPHFVFYVRKVLEEKYGKDVVRGGGLNIYTSLDLELQQMAEQKAAEHIEKIRGRNIHNASVVIMQPNTGQILAMVGSIDYDAVVPTWTWGREGNVIDGQVNVAIRPRQPGSALKPFTYLAAMEQGMTPATVLYDVPSRFDDGSGVPYVPNNYTDAFYGPVRIRGALANSLNIPAIKALEFVGVDYMLQFLDKVGIKSTLDNGLYGLSLTLGGCEVTPLELTTAYNTLASGGRYIQPTPILKITDSKGRILESPQYTTKQQVIEPALNSIIVDMMSDDQARAPLWGLGTALEVSRPAAVKTGTSENWVDAWTLGFTPYVTVGVWTGNNNNEPTYRVESLEGGGYIWHNVMEDIFKLIDQKPKYKRLFSEPFPNQELPEDFVIPDDGSIELRYVCSAGGGFGGRNPELFTRTMIDNAAAGVGSVGCIGNNYVQLAQSKSEGQKGLIPPSRKESQKSQPVWYDSDASVDTSSGPVEQSQDQPASQQTDPLQGEQQPAAMPGAAEGTPPEGPVWLLGPQAQEGQASSVIVEGQQPAEGAPPTLDVQPAPLQPAPQAPLPQVPQPYGEELPPPLIPSNPEESAPSFFGGIDN